MCCEIFYYFSIHSLYTFNFHPSLLVVTHRTRHWDVKTLKNVFIRTQTSTPLKSKLLVIRILFSTAFLLPLRTFFLTHPIFLYFARWFFLHSLVIVVVVLFCMRMNAPRSRNFIRFALLYATNSTGSFSSPFQICVCVRTCLSASRYSTYQSCLHQSNYCRLLGGSTEQNKGIIFVTLYANDVCVFCYYFNAICTDFLYHL